MVFVKWMNHSFCLESITQVVAMFVLDLNEYAVRGNSGDDETIRTRK